MTETEEPRPGPSVPFDGGLSASEVRALEELLRGDSPPEAGGRR